MKGHKGVNHHHPKAEHSRSGAAYKEGGKVEEEFYAGKGSKVAKEAEDKEDGFKKGGRAKKHVGKVAGEHGKMHAGRKPRKSGGKVLSAAAEGTKRPGFKG